MKILVSGLGSIGKRHLNNICKLVDRKNIYLHRSSDHPLPDFADLPVFTSLEEVLTRESFTHALVCNPTALHMKTAALLANSKIPNIFIEKPLSHSWFSVEEFQQTILQNGIRVTTGFDLRFDYGLLKIKRLLEDKVIGKIVMVQASVGQYLPDWRPHENYAKGMSASEAMGGGVILDLIHEVDYVSWLTGPASWLSCFSGKLSDLSIETEDVACITWMSEQGAVVNICLDYLQRRLSRSCKFIGTQGTIMWDYVNNRVEWLTAGSEQLLEYVYEQSRNERFMEELKNFLSDTPVEHTADLSDALHSLKLALGAKKSSMHRQMIMMDNFEPLQS